MTRQLCPKCLELLSETLACMFCGGHYTWVEREELISDKKQIKEEAKQQLENTDGDCNCKNCQEAKEILNSDKKQEKKK